MYHEFHAYPHTNLNEANLDYLCSKIGDVEKAAEAAAETAALAKEIKEEAQTIQESVERTAQDVDAQYNIVLEKASELAESVEQIAENAENIAELENGLETSNENIASNRTLIDNAATKAREVYDDNGKLKYIQLAFNVNANYYDTTTETHYLQSFTPLDIIMAKLFVRTVTELSAGSTYPIGSVASSLIPAYTQPLSVYVQGHKRAEVYIESSGSIYIHPFENISTGVGIYVTGFWHHT